jgi:3-hydroxy-9,10-secoandrosta-1,3,5(10)-triene-9,17-dione monooxygenase reductase component
MTNPTANQLIAAALTGASSATPLDPRSSDVAAPTIDPQAFRNALGFYASGVTIIAAHDGQEPIGFTCQSFHSVSLDPPLISFSVMRTSSSYPRIRANGKFSVNVLSKEQQAISNRFASKSLNRWQDVTWVMTPENNPAIAGTLIWLDCKILAEHWAGDHDIVVGEVLNMSPRDWHDGEPLVFFRGRYRHLHDPGNPVAEIRL